MLFPHLATHSGADEHSADYAGRATNVRTISHELAYMVMVLIIEP